MAPPLGIEWVDRQPGAELPPLDPTLAGWTIDRRRPSHWNARRQVNGRVYHLKWFFHGRWRQPARTEWRNAAWLERLGIPTVAATGWGRHARGSFVVLQGSAGRPLAEWREVGLSPAELLVVASRLAVLVARLHDAGLCHRDLNVYHVLVADGEPRLIDVGRLMPFRRRRWIVKDFASLRYTATREGLPGPAQRRFLRAYLQASRSPWRRRSLLRALLRKAARYRRHNEGVIGPDPGQP